VDPGGVATNLGRNNGLLPWMRHLAYYALKRQLQTPAAAAGTIVYLASSPDVLGITGKYFHALKQIRSSDVSYDREQAVRLWELSITLAGLDENVGTAWQYLKPSMKA
jgi:hypothetical protein